MLNALFSIKWQKKCFLPLLKTEMFVFHPLRQEGEMSFYVQVAILSQSYTLCNIRFPSHLHFKTFFPSLPAWLTCILKEPWEMWCQLKFVAMFSQHTHWKNLFGFHFFVVYKLTAGWCCNLCFTSMHYLVPAFTAVCYLLSHLIPRTFCLNCKQSLSDSTTSDIEILLLSGWFTGNTNILVSSMGKVCFKLLTRLVARPGTN
jgi:hypothetical protein